MARRRKDAKPTVEEIITRYREAYDHWGVLHAQMSEDYMVYKDKQPVGVPKGYNVVRLGTAGSIISTAADHITGDSPKVKVPEAGLSKKAQERSEDLEGGFQAALWRFQSALTENPIRTIVVNALWSGMMVTKGPLFLPDVWGKIPVDSEYTDKEAYADDEDEYETNKRVNWAFYWKPVDPRYVYPDPGTDGRKWVVVSYERTVGDIKEQWQSWDRRTPGMNKSDKPLAETVKVQWLEYWDSRYRAYLVGNVPVKGTSVGKAELLGEVYEHSYGKPPFQIRSSGYGSDSGEPHERYESIIRRAVPMLNQEIAVASQIDAIMRRTAWPIVLTPTGSGFDSLEPGTVKEMDEKAILATKTFTELQPQIPQMLLQEMDYLSNNIQEATFPNVVQGIKAKGIASGYGQNSLVATAKVKYGAAVVNLSSLLSEFFVDFGRCIQYVVEEPVPIWGETRWGMVDASLKPSDINDLKHVVVTVNPKLPADRANEIELGGVLLDRGSIDMDYYLQEFVGIENPGEMRVRVMRDRALADPAIQRVMALAAALKGGYIDYVLKLAVTIGMDPGQLLAVLGFGNPSQQAPAANQGAGAPNNVAAQRQGSSPTLFGGAQKAQPGSPSAVRDQVTPGLAIGA